MKILVVEDEPKTRNGLVALIQNLQPHSLVYAAEHAQQALTLCGEHFFDMIFTDIKMPGISGLDMLSRLERKGRQIVIVSGYADFEYAQQAIKYGVMEYILKPVNPVKIKEVLEIAAAKQAAVRRACLSNLLLNYTAMKDAIVSYHLSKIELKKMSALLIFKSLNTNADFTVVIEQTRRLLSDQQSNECDMISFNLKNISCTLLTFEDETVYKQAVEEIRAHFKGAYHLTDSGATTQVKDLHKFLAGYLSDLNLANEQSTGDGHVVKVIKDYIADNYQQNITLSDLAEITYLHTTYISKLFEKETGENISDYILNFRMKKAKKLLLNPKYKIYGVAEMTGFNDAKYFGNVFKSMVGMTPKEYRKGDE